MEVRVVDAPPGASVGAEFLLDGASLAEGEAILTAGSAQLELRLPEDLRWEPWDSAPPIGQCVAHLRDGAGHVLDVRRSRCAVGSVAYEEGRLRIDGQEVHLWATMLEPLASSPRGDLGRSRSHLRRAGVNALETHGWVPDPVLVEAAEELGLALVVLPRCPGAIPRAVAARLEEDREGQTLAGAMTETVATLEQSPSVVLWEREEVWLPLPGAARPIASLGAPPAGEQPVPVVVATKHTDRVTPHTSPSEPGTWIIEMLPEAREDAPSLDSGVLNAFADGWREHHLGFVLPPPYTYPALNGTSSEYIVTLDAGGRAPDAIGTRELRGPSTLQVEVLRQGEPAWGAPVELWIEGLPTILGATGPDGRVRFEVFWQGPARLRLGPLEQETELGPGHYGAQAWEPAVVEHRMSLPE